MPHRQVSLPALILTALAFTLPAVSADPQPLPLRVHIYQTSEHPHYRGQVLESVDGEGRANLYEHGQPRGLDFTFRCSNRVMTSSGFETYPARWIHKPQALEIFVPTIGGKPGSGHTCELKVNIKDFAYYRRSGAIESEPVSAFKHWMDEHQYDPEHGRNQPQGLKPE